MADVTWDHWWWRPGWRMGRSFYTWHVTFGDDSPVGKLVAQFAPVLREMPTMTPVVREGLHITIQGVGFGDEVSDEDLDAIIAVARRRLARSAAFEFEVGPPKVDEETVGMPVRDPGALEGVRAELRAAIGEVWGEEGVPERGVSFTPHLSLAYSTGAASISVMTEKIAAAGLEEVTATETVTAISLIELNRDARRYEWREVVRVPLAGHRTAGEPGAE
ncbi:2'-5' RNA ligase family protein [Nocardia sp. NPDC004068]|uniref:2'-5' RNA ligase family protein n=1 Tax=Nocardia sp. NPDC004068 TaxID=3364303 RepID=UPI0036C42288